ncbi:unhealthy ribosome biogenesis protein 2 homolog [Amphiura filiformis]|uniref:unhealthy ribosome biogenesis protein 2 homolog n=1 Tax=Amphiura filiformis TaxID=82378 RepID=UPI003B225381
MAGHIMLAGIHRSLKDADTPWNDKLKLARFAWCSSQCFLPNKQQVLLDWVCNALANQTKFDIEDETVCTLWQYLHDILNNKQMKKTIESSASMSIRDALYPVLCDALRVDSEYVSMATACCHIILQSASLGRSLTGKHDVMIDLLCALLHLVTKCLETSNSLQDTAVPCLKMLLKKFTLSHRQRQLQAHRKAFTAAYERLLIPALALYTCEEVGDKSKLKGQIEDLILMGIFNKDMSEVYRLYLTINRDSLEGRDKLKEGQFTDIDNFIEFLQKEAQHCKEKDSRINPVLAGLPVLYRTFIAAYKPTADAKFAMLKKLCGIMGISPAAKDSGIASSPPPSCDWEQALPALELILKDVYTNDIYVVSVDNSEGQPKFQWFLQLLQLLLTSADKPSASLFNCLHTFLDLNHMLIEEELTPIWNVSLMTHPSSLHRADNFEESRTAFLGSLMQTYVKLRQFDKLLECLLASFNQEEPSTDNTGDNLVYFNSGFVHRFSQCIQELPPGLTLDLWKLFKDDLVNSYITRISDATNLEPPKKKKRRSAASFSKNIETGLEQAAGTFHLFLTSARVIDLSATKVMMDRTEALMEETQKEVLQALHTLCQNATEEVYNKWVTAFLNSGKVTDSL